MGGRASHRGRGRAAKARANEPLQREGLEGDTEEMSITGTPAGLSDRRKVVTSPLI